MAGHDEERCRDCGGCLDCISVTCRGPHGDPLWDRSIRFLMDGTRIRVSTEADQNLREAAERIWSQNRNTSAGLATPEQRRIYIIGSLRDPEVVGLALRLRDAGYEVYDDWYSAGPEADDAWQRHQSAKDVSFKEALQGPHAQCVIDDDAKWLMWANTVIMVGSGKSRGIELGWRVGQGAQGFILLSEEPLRWDVMYGLGGTRVVYSVDELLTALEAR